MTRLAFPYSRVSTTDQFRNGVSLETQQSRAEAWVAAHGYQIGRMFSDPARSGKRENNRPGLQEAITAACKSKGVLVVYSLSRMARSVTDALSIARRLQHAGADLASLTEQIDTTSAAGRLIYTVLAAVAVFEREITAERTADTLALKRSELKKYGEIKYGYYVVTDPHCRKHGGEPEKVCSCRLIEDADEQAVLTLMRELKLQDATWNDVAEELNSLHILSKKGRLWTGQNVRKIALAEALIPKRP